MVISLSRQTTSPQPLAPCNHLPGFCETLSKFTVTTAGVFFVGARAAISAAFIANCTQPSPTPPRTVARILFCFTLFASSWGCIFLIFCFVFPPSPVPLSPLAVPRGADVRDDEHSQRGPGRNDFGGSLQRGDHDDVPSAGLPRRALLGRVSLSASVYCFIASPAIFCPY